MTGTLLAALTPGLFQQAFVVADLEAACAALAGPLGVERWARLEPAPLPYRFRGAEVRCTLAIAFGRSGDLQIECIQPVDGTGLHAEWMTDHGPGAHHLGFRVDDLDAVVEQAAAEGIEAPFSGAFGTLRFAYLDTVATLGCYAEAVEDPDGVMFGLMPWRDQPPGAS